MKKLLILLLMALVLISLTYSEMQDLGDGTFYDNDTGWYYYELEPKESPKVLRTEYTANSKITEYSDRIVNAVKYGVMKYANSSGTTIEEAYSLKDCEFCDKIKLSIKYDEKYPLAVLDYNYTSIKIEFHTTDENEGKLVPLEISDKKDENIKYETSYVLIQSKESLYTTIVKFNSSNVLRFGYNSTTIEFNYTSDPAECGIVYNVTAPGQWNIAHDSLFGIIDKTTLVTLQSYYLPIEAQISRLLYPINTSMIPDDAIIISANLSIFTSQRNDADPDGMDYFALTVSNMSNPYSLQKTDYISAGNIDNPILISNKIMYASITDVGYTTWVLNQTGLNIINVTGYTKIGMREGHDIQDEATAGQVAIDINLDTVGQDHIFRVTYSMPSVYNLTILNPTSSSPKTVNSGNKVNTTFVFILNNVNQTDLDMNDVLNITLNASDGTKTIANFAEQSTCTGTLDCSAYLNESTCNNCSQCNWTTFGSGNTNYSQLTCNGYYGWDCGTGPPESDGDNTFDSCGNGLGSDDSVENIFINSTTVKPNDVINVVCMFDPYTSSDDSYISYYNGTGWEVVRSDLNWGSASLTNKSVNITIDNYIGKHAIRCSITYYPDVGTNECMNPTTNNYYDNDDVNITVISGTSTECKNTSSSCSSCALGECDTNCSLGGCSLGDQKECGLRSGTTQYECNWTAPDLSGGSYDIKINMTYNSVIYNASQTDAIVYGGGEPPSNCWTYNQGTKILYVPNGCTWYNTSFFI